MNRAKILRRYAKALTIYKSADVGALLAEYRQLYAEAGPKGNSMFDRGAWDHWPVVQRKLDAFKQKLQQLSIDELKELIAGYGGSKPTSKKNAIEGIERAINAAHRAYMSNRM